MNLIQQLKQFDNEEGYKLSYDEVKQQLQPIIPKLINEEYLDDLHSLLINEETWSCLFALEILTEIRSVKSVLFLIEFIKKNDDSDYFESGEQAMFALRAIGKPAIKPLLKEVKELFDRRKYLFYLVGALTEIKDESVYSFIVSVVEDYLNDFEKYKGWFAIDDFTYHLDSYGNKEKNLELLKKILKMGLSNKERIEIEDTIKKIEDPEGFEKEIEDSIKMRKLGRNELCHCGSGIKYKKCCLEKDLKETGKAKRVPDLWEKGNFRPL